MKPTLSEMSKYLDQIQIPIRLACRTESGWPVVLSLWFLYENEYISCATQESAKIVKYLKYDNRCAFEIAEDRPPYCGVRGQAKAKIETSQGKETLEKLLVRYLGGTDHELAKKLLNKSDTEVAIILKPIQIFSWDFSNRMVNVPHQHPTMKACP